MFSHGVNGLANELSRPSLGFQIFVTPTKKKDAEVSDGYKKQWVVQVNVRRMSSISEMIDMPVGGTSHAVALPVCSAPLT